MATPKSKARRLRALFVRVGINQSHFLHAFSNCLRKMEPRHLRTLRSPALSSSNVRIVCLSFIKRCMHYKLSQYGIDNTSVCYYANDIRILLHDFQSVHSAMNIAWLSVLFLLPRFPLPRFPALIGAENSTPAISTPVLRCHDFHSRVFHSREFSVPMQTSRQRCHCQAATP